MLLSYLTIFFVFIISFLLHMPIPRIAYTKTCNRIFLYFHPPQGTQTEPDFNSMIYLCHDEADNPEFVYRQTIAQMILNPNAFNPQYSTLKMRPDHLQTVTRPAHIPSFEDCYALPPEAKLLMKWYLETKNYIPRNLQHLIDPKPVLDLNIPPIRLCLDTVYLCMGTFTDVIQVLDVPIFECMIIIQIYKAIKSPNRGPFHIVAFDPVLCPNWVPNLQNVPLNTKLVCWNVRGIGRDSFLENFQLMYGVFNPSVVILLQTRHFDENVKEIVSRLPVNFIVHTSFIHSCSGGTAILYKEEVIKMVGNPLFSNYALTDVVLQGRESEPPNLKSLSNKKLKTILE